jgi:hypothetical protein
MVPRTFHAISSTIGHTLYRCNPMSPHTSTPANATLGTHISGACGDRSVSAHASRPPKATDQPVRPRRWESSRPAPRLIGNTKAHTPHKSAPLRSPPTTRRAPRYPAEPS